MKVRHGGFQIDIPSGWSDQSTLLFVGPRDRSSGPAEAVAVTFAGPTENAREILEQQAARLESSDPSFERIEDAPFECALGRGHQFVQALELGGEKVQIAVAVPVNDATIIATATCARARYDVVKEELMRILSSMSTTR